MSAEARTAGRVATAGTVGEVVEVGEAGPQSGPVVAVALLLSCTESASTLGLGRASGLAAEATAAITEVIPSRRRIGAREVIPENNVGSRPHGIRPCIARLTRLRRRAYARRVPSRLRNDQ